MFHLKFARHVGLCPKINHAANALRHLQQTPTSEPQLQQTAVLLYLVHALGNFSTIT